MKLFSKVPKKLIAALVTIAAIAGIGAGVMAGFGPDRPTKQWSPVSNGFDYVTFNSFVGVGNGVGDERDFLRGVQVGRDSTWADPVNGVADTSEIEAKIYIHNNADTTLNDAAGNPGIARNVNVRVAIPTGSSQAKDVTSYISASNATPQQIFDTLSLTGANSGFFELEYVPGSAKLSDQSGAVTAVDDALVTTGVSIGDQKGCFESVREVRFRMKVKMPNWSISKQVKIVGQPNWSETVAAQPSDTLSWLISFNNIGNTTLNNVSVVDNVPAGLTVVPGTVKLTNGNFPNGTVVTDDSIQANGRQVSVNIGSYAPNVTGYVTFRTTVDMAGLQCGENTITNEAYTTPEGYGATRDTATATVSKTCDVVVVKKCTGLTVDLLAQQINQPFTFTASAEVSNAVVAGYNFEAKNAAGAIVDSFGVATSATSASWNKAFSAPGTYTVSVTINTDKGQAEGTCEKVVTVSEQPVVIKRCIDLGVFPMSRTSFYIDTIAEAQNATIQSYVYTIRDASGKVVETKTITSSELYASLTYTNAKPGAYSIGVVINTDKGIADGDCFNEFVVDQEPVTPIAKCNGVNVDVLGERKVKITVANIAEPASRVTVQGYEYNFGNGVKIDQTDKSMVEYTYDKDGTYNIAVKVTFLVDGDTLVTSTENCAQVVTITTQVEKCEYNAALPKGDSKCRPKCQYNNSLLDNDPKCVKVTTIPNTGAGSMIGMFIVSALLGMFIYRFSATRQN